MSATEISLRPELAALAPYNSGLSLEDVASRCGGRPIAKLGSNENPHPLPAPRARGHGRGAGADADVSRSRLPGRWRRSWRQRPGWRPGASSLATGRRIC